jgi:hypothetical protein
MEKPIPVEYNKLIETLEFLNRVQHSDVDDSVTLQARQLKAYLENLLRVENLTPYRMSYSGMGAKGGLAKSDAKIAAARENAKKGGAPGTYYACLYTGVQGQTRGSAALRRRAIYIAFEDKQSRDDWVSSGRKNSQEVGYREALPAIDRDLKWVKRNEPDAIEYFTEKYERYHDIMESCDSCGMLIERKDLHNTNAGYLCNACFSAIQ